MKELRGKSIHPGVVIAAVARIDSLLGVNGASVALLEEGMKSLRKRLDPSDYTQAVVLCDDLATGLGTSIPGVSIIGVACRSDAVPSGLHVSVPCVVGLPGLMDVAAEDVFVILDGDDGRVCIDPDVQTLIRYQQQDTARIERHRVAIDFQHIPAKTAHGFTVYVFGLVRSERELELAVDQGADGLLIEMRDCDDQSYDLIRCALQTLPGKPVWAVDDALLPDEARSLGLPSLLGPVVVQRMADTHPQTSDQEFLFSVCDLELVETIAPDVSKEEADAVLAIETALCVDGTLEFAEAVDAGLRVVIVPGDAVSSAKERVAQIGLEDFD